VAVRFDTAAAETAAAGEPSGIRFHLQGEVEQHGPPPDDPVEPGETDQWPVETPAEEGPPLGALAPGDSVQEFLGLANTGWIPPDTVLAAGPSSLVEVVNSGFAVYSKGGGTLQGYTTFDFFVAPALPSGWQGFLFDPRVLYSPEHSRFVMLVLGLDAVNQESYFFIAVSQTTDPTGLWWLYRFAADDPNSADSDSWADYCGLGADTWGLYVTCNMFRWTGTFKHGKLWSLNPAMFTGGSGNGWGFWDLRWNNNSQAFSLQPATPYSIAGDQATFFANTFSFSGSSVLLWKLTGDRTSSPTLVRSTIGTQLYSAIGQNVDQPGSSTDLDGGDARILNAAYKDRKVYTVLTHDPGNNGLQSGWLLFKLDVDTSSRDWQHLVAPPVGFYYFYPAITLDGAGGSVPLLAIFGSWTDAETSITSSTNYASGLFKVLTNQTVDGDGPFVSFYDGLAPYVRLDSNNRNRWGDYSGAAYDWTTGNVWGAVEAAGSGNTWRTVIKSLEMGGCGPDGFEPDDSSGQASPISSGVPQTHDICPVGDEDWVRFDLPSQSAIILETSGSGGDTRMWLYDSGLNQIEFDDDGGSSLFSRIDRTCGADPLAAGTYYVQVDEFGDDDEIGFYNLTYTLVESCSGGCVGDLVLQNDSITGSQTYRATASITVGPNLEVTGSDIEMIAGQNIVLRGGTTIGGSFTATISANPCTAQPGSSPR
jgi:hypothetical protein